MQGYPDGVKAPGGHRVDVYLTGMVSQPAPVKLFRLLLPYQVGYLFLYPVLLAERTQPEHISFLEHPAPQSHSPENDFFTFTIDDDPALCF